jgi:serine protease Do
MILLVTLRFLLPSMLEFSRYSWHRGQLRAEYEMAGQQLQQVSMEGLSSLSQTVARRVCPSVVHITLDHVLPRSTLTDEGETIMNSFPAFRPSFVGQGSGVIVDARGYIITNYHVINDEENRMSAQGRINVSLADDRICKAELIGFDAARDLAVIKIEADQLLPAEWGDSESMEIGAPVWAVGSPFGLTGSITFGILSGKHRLDLSGTNYSDKRLTQSGKHLPARYSDLMQSDVAVNPGNSGGPLVNTRGELIGINTAIIGEAYRGVSFSIPSSIAKISYDQIIQFGRMRYGWLGVSLIKESDWRELQAKQLQLMMDDNESTFDETSDPISDKPKLESAKAVVQGAVIQRIFGSETPAAKAGLQVGDRIVAFNHQNVKGVDELIFAISKQPVGSMISLTIERAGVVQVLQVEIGERPE